MVQSISVQSKQSIRVFPEELRNWTRDLAELILNGTNNDVSKNEGTEKGCLSDNYMQNWETTLHRKDFPAHF